MKRLPALALCLMLCGNLAVQAGLPRPNLIPQPQVVEKIHAPLDLGAGVQVLCEQRGQRMMQAALEEISRRLKALGAPAPAMWRVDPPSLDAPAPGPATLRIVIGTAEGSPLVARVARELGVQVDAKNPGPQGYVIRFGSVKGSPTALLAGSDELGALYACVTLAQMLRGEDGRVRLDAADVRDWPDFRMRIIGHPRTPSERLRKAQSRNEAGKEYSQYVAAMRQAVDQCVAYKINALTLRSGGTGKWSNVQSFGPAARAALREVSDYARDRGVQLEATAYSAIDVGQGGPAAQLQDIVRTHGVGYCWSNDELLHAQGREYGRFARDAGISLYYLHAPDANPPGNPGLFLNRCPQCKARWKDGERAQADAHVMQIMAGEIQALSPQTRICAVLVPYGATLDKLDSGDREEIVNYWREANAALPPEMAICVRENRRPNVAFFKETFARHSIYFYIESIFWQGWEPLFSTTPRNLKTFDFDDPRDIYFMGNAADFGALSEALAAHYAWNTHAPGAGEQRAYNHNPLEDGAQPAEVAGPLLDRIAARMFGEEIGPLVGEAVRGDISWAFTEEPEAMARAAADRLAGRGSDIVGAERIEIAGLRDLPTLMRHQAEGAAAGRRALRQVVARMRSGAWRPDDWQRGQINFLLSYNASVEALASVRYPVLAATAANLRRDNAQAQALAQAGLKAADAAPGILKETEAWVGGMEQWYPKARRVAEMVAGERPRLEHLLKLAQGRVTEQADTPAHLAQAVFLLRGRKVTPRSSGNGDLVLTDQFTRTPGEKALHFTRPEQPWAGCSVKFDPVDIRPFAKQDGYLRFYVNSDGPKGWQRATFWGEFQDAAGSEVKGKYVYLHKPSAKEERKNDWPGFVDVDDLPETWQLVSIPLAQLAGGNAAFLSGLHLNFAKVPDCGLVIADPYLIGPAQPVWVER